MNQEEKAFIIRAYDKAELAELYSPGRTKGLPLYIKNFSFLSLIGQNLLTTRNGAESSIL